MISWFVLHGCADGAGEVNQAGIDHYNEEINALLAKGWLTAAAAVHANHYNHTLEIKHYMNYVQGFSLT